MLWFLNISYITITEKAAKEAEELSRLQEDQFISDNDCDIAEEEIHDINFEVHDNEDFDYLSGEAFINGIFRKW